MNNVPNMLMKLVTVIEVVNSSTVYISNINRSK